MRLISFRLVLIALVTVLFAGCLTVDKKITIIKQIVTDPVKDGSSSTI
ncbi:MAG: hypothetical protein IPN18_01485 [Ignavibacteriales bacterium]|nr:hypothetical protein [Ignavibacteriales bacterium]